MILKIKKLKPDAKIPKFAHDDDAAMDIFSCEEYNIKPQTKHIFSTGIAMEIPDNYAGFVWEKSSLGMEYGLVILGGLIDSGFRGEIKIGIYNSSNESYAIKKDDKIANLVIQKIERPKIIITNKLSKTKRGAGAMGSTGRK